MQKIATFNINYTHRRLPNLLRWLRSVKPDASCPAVMKSNDDISGFRDRQVPLTARSGRGQRTWTGSRDPFAQGRPLLILHRFALDEDDERRSTSRSRRQRHHVTII